MHSAILRIKLESLVLLFVSVLVPTNLSVVIYLKTDTPKESIKVKLSLTVYGPNSIQVTFMKF